MSTCRLRCISSEPELLLGLDALMLLLRRKRLLRRSSTVQAVIGVSSVESEYYALTFGACKTLVRKVHANVNVADVLSKAPGQKHGTVQNSRTALAEQ
eukprot:5870511-Amphidinium_carterae.1